MSYVQIAQYFREGDLKPVDVKITCGIKPECYKDPMTDQKNVEQQLRIAGNSAICIGKNRCQLELVEDQTTPINPVALLKKVKIYQIKKVQSV